MQTKAIIKRNNQIYKNFLKGKTRAELAKDHNLSYERIRQICRRLEVQRSENYRPVTPNYKF